MIKKIALVSLFGGLLLLSGCQSNLSTASTANTNPTCQNIIQQLHHNRQTTTATTIGTPQKKTAISEAKLLEEYKSYNCGPELNNQPTVFNANTYP